MLRHVSVLFGLFMLGVAFALSGSGHADDGVEQIAVGSVTGSHGYEGAGGDSTSGNVSTVSAYYGYHCSGSTCEGSDTPPDKSNTLTITLLRATGDTTTYHVKGRPYMTDKTAELDVTDGDCPQGPPIWSATGYISMSGASVTGSFSDTSPMLADMLRHTMHPQTAFTKSSPDGGIAGTTYTNTAGEWSEEWTWSYDPGNPSTNSFVVQCQVTTTFSGTAKEIVVATCKMKAKCILDVAW